MQFYFVRHAQSADNLFVAQNADKGVTSTGLDQSYINRQSDPELSPAGNKQIQHLNQFVAKRTGDVATNDDVWHDLSHVNALPLTHVYSSLMVRSMETALAIAKGANLKPAAWIDLHETGGIWEGDEETGKPVGKPGNNRAYFEERFPDFDLPASLGEEGWWNKPMERSADVKIRADRFTKDLFEKHGSTDDHVAAVGHGLFYSYVMNRLLRIPSGTKVRFAVNNVAITRLDFLDNDVVMMRYQNRTDFLPSDLIT